MQLLLQDDEDLKRLATLKEMKEVVEKRTKTIGNESNSFEVVFKERIDILRNRYAREKLLKQINEFRELFEQLQQAGGRFGRLSTLYNNLVAERADRSEELEKSSKGILSTINFELEFKEHYLQWLESRASKTPNFIIQRGKDPVFGTAHHLPLLFENGGNQKELISQITQRYIRDEVEALKSKANAADLDANIEDLIKKQTTESFAHQGKPEPEDILVRSLLNLIIPFDRTKKKSYTPEEMVIQVAKKQIDLIAFEGDVLLLGDYYYLLCWACRRDKQYERSRKYAELGKQLNENDPRFWHGLFLYNYCEFRECIKKTTLTIEGNASSALPFLGKAIETSQKALEKYESWLTDAKRTEDPIVLKKTKAALMTGIIIVHAYLYAIEGDIDFLTKSREVTQDLKKFEGTAYGQQPEYLYVESFLEYQEYCEFQKKNQSELAQRKLQQARAAIESACKAIPDRSQYSAWKKELAKLT
ncbi:MAG: hypothetical protein EAZ91_18410 [Cytophagales bacterium]|nr:MAG: hypothetical protein EAZ91_18410 [Cytophagales bacterium]